MTIQVNMFGVLMERIVAYNVFSLGVIIIKWDWLNEGNLNIFFMICVNHWSLEIIEVMFMYYASIDLHEIIDYFFNFHEIKELPR